MSKPNQVGQLNQFISVNVHIEDDCNKDEGEYSINLGSSTKFMDISDTNGNSDISKIKECVDEFIAYLELEEHEKKNVDIDIILIDRYESYDVFYEKHFDVLQYSINSY